MGIEAAAAGAVFELLAAVNQTWRDILYDKSVFNGFVLNLEYRCELINPLFCRIPRSNFEVVGYVHLSIIPH